VLSIKTGNPIESTFGTKRHRIRRTNGFLNRDIILHMIPKMFKCGEKKWRKSKGFDYLAKIYNPKMESR
tara:strand:- start:197 stop:403 length:207 start_codon:yes stop_codon:yes gene_type:complete